MFRANSRRGEGRLWETPGQEEHAFPATLEKQVWSKIATESDFDSTYLILWRLEGIQKWSKLPTTIKYRSRLGSHFRNRVQCVCVPSGVETLTPMWRYLEVVPVEGDEVMRVDPSCVGWVPYNKRPDSWVAPFPPGRGTTREPKNATPDPGLPISWTMRKDEKEMFPV